MLLLLLLFNQLVTDFIIHVTEIDHVKLNIFRTSLCVTLTASQFDF
jgi:hypothetical protein